MLTEASTKAKRSRGAVAVATAAMQAFAY